MSWVDKIKQLDTTLFLFLNGKHNSFFDFIMFWASNKFIWIPLYILFILFIFRAFDKQYSKIIIAALLLILLSDQISNHLFKNTFERYRPCHNALIAPQVHLNPDCGGMYGFVSSHAANSFALATFLLLIFWKERKYYGILLLFWAALVSYSRIYNGLHYPMDVLCGAMLGAILAFIVYNGGKRLWSNA